jgi:hypothetical protein
MWNMGQNETSFYFCMKPVLKLVSCKNRGMFQLKGYLPYKFRLRKVEA